MGCDASYTSAVTVSNNANVSSGNATNKRAGFEEPKDENDTRVPDKLFSKKLQGKWKKGIKEMELEMVRGYK